MNFDLSLASILGYVLAAGAIIMFWRNGGNKASSEALNAFKIRVDQLIEDKRASDLKIATLEKNLYTLQGTLAEKESKIREYIAILQDKNPEQKQFMEMMVRVAKEAELWMIAQGKIIDDIHNHVHNGGRVIESTTPNASHK